MAEQPDRRAFLKSLGTDGPTLKGRHQEEAVSLEDYWYSAAMKPSDITWTPMTLDA